jgi:hypothetical protein
MAEKAANPDHIQTVEIPNSIPLLVVIQEGEQSN